MTIHVNATTQCNLGCTYCYEEPDREVSDVDQDYDIEAIMQRLKEWVDKHPHDQPGLHGGEPLVVKNEDLERIFKFAYEETGGSHIQTNGTMITEEIIEMFEKYNVDVGISKDGPNELNRRRLARSGNEDATDLMSQKTEEAIHKVSESDANLGIIVVLHKHNAGTDEKLEKLLDWIDDLNQKGISGHYNPAIPYEDVQQDESLSPERLKEVYLRTWEWMKEEPYREWDPMRTYQDNLLGNTLENCVNSECDVFNTSAAKIVKGNGETTGCGKTWSRVGDGNGFLQGGTTGNEFNETRERYKMLKQTPGKHGDGPDLGGCKGCKFWQVCRGGCPSSGKDYDYRNRTRWCKAKYALYEKIEQDMKRMFPGIRLITDLKWDAPIEKSLKRSQLDIEPFAAMSQTKSESPTVRGGDASKGKPLWAIEYSDLKFEERLKKLRERFGEENVTGSEDGGIHVDTSGGKRKQESASPEEIREAVGDMSYEEKKAYLKERFGEDQIVPYPEEGKVKIKATAFRN